MTHHECYLLRKKKDKGKDGKRPVSQEVKGEGQVLDEPKENAIKESDLLLMQR